MESERERESGFPKYNGNIRDKISMSRYLDYNYIVHVMVLNAVLNTIRIIPRRSLQLSSIHAFCWSTILPMFRRLIYPTLLAAIPYSQCRNNDERRMEFAMTIFIVRKKLTEPERTSNIWFRIHQQFFRTF